MIATSLVRVRVRALVRPLMRVLLVATLGVGAIACSAPPEKPSRVTPRVVVGDVPCGPDKVLKNVCQFCHTNPPQHGAPFPLVTYANTQAELDGHPIFYWMEKYVTAEIMPLPPVEISDGDRAILLKWLRAGAPPREVGVTCDGDGGVVTPDAGTLRDSAGEPDGGNDPIDAIDAPDGSDESDAITGSDTTDATDADAPDGPADDGAGYPTRDGESE